MIEEGSDRLASIRSVNGEMQASLLLRPQRAGRVRGVRIFDTGWLWAHYDEYGTMLFSYDTRAQAARAAYD